MVKGTKLIESKKAFCRLPIFTRWIQEQNCSNNFLYLNALKVITPRRFIYQITTNYDENKDLITFTCIISIP